MALAISKTLTTCIGSKPNVSAVAEAFKIKESSAYVKIADAVVLGSVNGNAGVKEKGGDHVSA